MKYFGKEKIKTIKEKTRNLEYIRCDGCNKKFKNGEEYFDIYFSDGYGKYGESYHKQAHINCILDVINKYKLENISAELEKIDMIDENWAEDNWFDSSEDELVENDKVRD